MNGVAEPARTRVAVYGPENEGEPLPEWLCRNRDPVRRSLVTHGCVILEGFGIGDVARFQRARDVLLPARARYVEAATPRTAFGDDVFSSTDFTASEEIRLHNENSYANAWPGYLLFGCLASPRSGGATPVADVRGVLARLPRGLVDEFAARGWMLVRNYGSGFGLPWEAAFGTTDTTEVAEYCRQAGVDCEWLGSGRLRTRQIRPVLARHPVTGEPVWFNHVHFWHGSSLDPEMRELLTEELGTDGLPFDTRYGDGAPIPDAVVADVRAAYEAEKVARPWRASDLMLVDNMLVAHGRQPYEGERRVVVAMGEERRRADCEVRVR